MSGKTETCTITVTYETQELYGKVEASRTITIAADAPDRPQPEGADR